MTVNSRPTTKSRAKRRALLLRKEEKQSREVINPWAAPLAQRRDVNSRRETDFTSERHERFVAGYLIVGAAQRALSGNVFMGWDMNLEDRYREFVRLIR